MPNFWCQPIHSSAHRIQSKCMCLCTNEWCNHPAKMPKLPISSMHIMFADSNTIEVLYFGGTPSSPATMCTISAGTVIVIFAPTLFGGGQQQPFGRILYAIFSFVFFFIVISHRCVCLRLNQAEETDNWKFENWNETKRCVDTNQWCSWWISKYVCEIWQKLVWIPRKSTISFFGLTSIA